jgi:hypothetical protein
MGVFLAMYGGVFSPMANKRVRWPDLTFSAFPYGPADWI